LGARLKAARDLIFSLGPFVLLLFFVARMFDFLAVDVLDFDFTLFPEAYIANLITSFPG
jgi:hypothetical protein